MSRELEQMTYFDLCKTATWLGIDTGSRFPYVENPKAREQLIAEIKTAEAAEAEQRRTRDEKAARIRRLGSQLGNFSRIVSADHIEITFEDHMYRIEGIDD